MKKDKPRHNPDKPQNKYGGDYDCDNYDTTSDGIEFCHDEGQAPQQTEYIKWQKRDKDGNLVCKGNAHNCHKQKLKWLAKEGTISKDLGIHTFLISLFV
jgi:hypothetical protein